MKADGLKPVVQVATRKPTLASFPWVTEPDIVANDPPNKPSPITIMSATGCAPGPARPSTRGP